MQKTAETAATTKSNESKVTGEGAGGNDLTVELEQISATVSSPSPAAPASATAKKRPTSTVEGELAARLRLAVLRLSRQLRQQLVGDLTPSQVSVLSSVETLGKPTLGELAAREKVQPPSMTRQIDTLVATGFLDREVNPADRRIVRVKLTPQGMKILQQNRSVRTAFVAARLKRLPPEERDKLEELVTLLERLVEPQ
ncbi:MAG: MarR family transcriptional regulator [Acidimicrobiales bacterium]